MNYYVYYKLEPARAAEVRRAVERLFESAEQRFGVRGRWMRRRDDPSTYMEVYEGIADAAAFDVFLEREAAIPGVERRTERFISA